MPVKEHEDIVLHLKVIINFEHKLEHSNLIYNFNITEISRNISHYYLTERVESS